MKFLVTGATGFAGPHLMNLLLKEGHEVFGLIRCSNGRQADVLDVMSIENYNAIIWLFSDLCDYFSLEQIFTEYQFDGVFHLAAQSHPPTSFSNPVLTYNSNVMGSVNLITCIEKYQKDCHFHFCSSSEVYGDTCKDKGMLHENTSLHPCNPYGASKAAIDLYVQERIANEKIQGFITRAFSHTGPRRGYTFSISSDAYQIAKIKKDMQDKVLLIGNLKTQRVVIDVRDCVFAYYLLMMSKCFGVFNVCGEDVYKMQYFTDRLLRFANLYDEVEQQIHKPFYRDIDIQVQIGNCKKLKIETGWCIQIPIEQTLNDLLIYWLKHLEGK